MRRPGWPVLALLLYIALLPFHSLVIALLLAHTDLPLPLLKLLAAWKEVLLLVTFLGVLAATVVRKELPPLVWVDWIALAWATQVLLYFVSQLFFYRSSGLLASLYGARDWTLYLFPYCIGRLVSVSERDLTRVLRALLAIGAVTSLAGILEYLFVPTGWHLVIGIPRYFGEFLAQHYPATWGLPPNYWQGVGDELVRRAVSVHLSGQGFALPFLLLWPLCLLNLHARLTRAPVLIVVLNAVALVLTLTRMTIAVCFLQGLMLFWLLGRKHLQFPYLAVAVVASALFLTGSIPLRTENPSAGVAETGSTITFRRISFRSFVRDTATLQDSSSKVRPKQWTDGLVILRDHPAGMGLGSTGQTAARFGRGSVGSEAGYLKVVGALGYPGLLAFLGWFLGIIVFSFTASRSPDRLWQGLAALTLATAVGFLINNLTAPPDQSLFLIYIFPWLAGMTVRRSVQQRRAVTQWSAGDTTLSRHLGIGHPWTGQKRP